MKNTRSLLLMFLYLFLVSGCGFPFGVGVLGSGATPQARTSVYAVPQGVLRVHYRRFDRRYADWGLHFWGTAVNLPTKWNAPVEFSMSDSYGRYVDININNYSGTLSFLVHRGNTRDVAVERRVGNLGNVREIWLKQEQDAVWFSEPSTEPEFVFAEFVSPNLIRGIVGQEGAASWKNVSVRDQFGNVVPNRTVDVNGSNVYVTLNSRADFSKTYKLALGEQEQWVRYSGPVLDSEFNYEGNDLGAILRDDGTVRFKLWTPPATEVVVHMFDPMNSYREIGKKPLVRGNAGVWSIDVAPYEVGLSSLDAVLYQYEVTALGQTRFGLDPYAKSMADFNPAAGDIVGKAAILSPRRWAPKGFAEDVFENSSVMRSRSDMVAYEIHVRDFTSDPASGVEELLRGTYAGLTKKIPYLKDLGITHVQLLPVQNYYTVNESDRAFRGANARNLNYNWGYDPHNYFTPEGWLSTNSSDPYRRVLELKDMIRQLHSSGIGVILDVVYNHTYNANVFENVCPGCYYRADDRGRISTFTGAGPSLESRRLMVRKLIIDSLKYFVDEYHVNGFRFDLMGFIDRATMENIRDVLGPDVILHGEAWEFSDLPAGVGTTKSNLPKGREIGAFADTTRDSIAGRMDGKGFVQGNIGLNPKFRSAIIGNIRGYNTDYDGNGSWDVNITGDWYDRFASSPIENLGFVTVHDGFTLWDKINLSWKGSAEERSRLSRFAYSSMLLSQGRAILHGGDEIARTKPLAVNDPYPDRAASSALVNEDFDLPGVKSFHENSYSSSDYTNMVRWGRYGTKWGRDLFNYTKQLIALRRDTPVFRLESSDDVSRSLRFVAPKQWELVGSFAPAAGKYAGFKSFSEVPGFTLRFIHGPENKIYSLAGEIFPSGMNKNPVEGAWEVKFDADGSASVFISKESIQKFDLSAWGDNENLQVKVVKNPGTWDSPAGAYSSMGNNSIRPSAIEKDGTITVDLAQIDNVPGTLDSNEKAYIAFEIDPAKAKQVRIWEGEIRWSRYGIAHNSSKNPISVAFPSLVDPSQWVVLLDDTGANSRGLQDSNVEIRKGYVIVPPKSSVVVARRP